MTTDTPAPAQTPSREQLGADYLLGLMDDDARRLLAYNNRVHLFVPLGVDAGATYAWEYGGRFQTVPETEDEPIRYGPALMAVDYCGNVEGVGGMLPCDAGDTLTVPNPSGAATPARVESIQTVRMPDGEWRYLITIVRGRS